MSDSIEIPVGKEKELIGIRIIEMGDYDRNIIGTSQKFEIKLLITSDIDKRFIYEASGVYTRKDLQSLVFETTENTFNVHLDFCAYDNTGRKYHFAPISESNPFLQLIKTQNYSLTDYPYTYSTRRVIGVIGRPEVLGHVPVPSKATKDEKANPTITGTITLEVIEEERFKHIFEAMPIIAIEDVKSDIELLEGQVKKAQKELETYRNTIKNFKITTTALGDVDRDFNELEGKIQEDISRIFEQLSILTSTSISKAEKEKVRMELSDKNDLITTLLLNKALVDDCLVAKNIDSPSWLKVGALTDKRLSTLTNINYIIKSLEIIKKNTDTKGSELSNLVLTSTLITGDVSEYCTIKILNYSTKDDTTVIYTTTSNIDNTFSYTFVDKLSIDNEISVYGIDLSGNESDPEIVPNDSFSEEA